MADGADIRLFAKPNSLPNRRMGVALATGTSVEEAIARAEQAAATVRIIYA
jgi:phosphoribosylglycinamide formyltransferase 2